ncbi:hypothetical protein ACQJBY_035639 [Aegilops geniculata]
MVAEMVVAPLNSPVLITALAFLLVLITVLVSTRHGSNAPRLPPSPRGLPVVGHLHLLGSLPHRSLRSLAASHGPVMHLRLGRVPTVVASSAAAAEEAMKTRDLDFAGRPRLLMVDRFYYGTGGIGFAPYGEHWRQARRVCAVHMLSARRVASLGRVRAREAAALVDRVRRAGSGVVNLSDNLVVYSNAVMSRCTLGDADCGVEGGGARLRKAFGEMEELLGTVPMGETVPWLGWVDVVTGLERRARRVFEEMDGLLERVIADHRQRRRAAAAGDAGGHPAAGPRRAGGHPDPDQRLGHRPRPGDVGAPRRGVRAGEVRRVRRCRAGLLVPALRRREEGLPRGGVRHAVQRAGAGEPRAWLRLGAARREGAAGGHERAVRPLRVPQGASASGRQAVVVHGYGWRRMT